MPRSGSPATWKGRSNRRNEPAAASSNWPASDWASLGRVDQPADLVDRFARENDLPCRLGQADRVGPPDLFARLHDGDASAGRMMRHALHVGQLAEGVVGPELAFLAIESPDAG